MSIKFLVLGKGGYFGFWGGGGEVPILFIYGREDFSDYRLKIGSSKRGWSMCMAVCGRGSVAGSQVAKLQIKMQFGGVGVSGLCSRAGWQIESD